MFYVDNSVKKLISKSYFNQQTFNLLRTCLICHCESAGINDNSAFFLSLNYLQIT